MCEVLRFGFLVLFGLVLFSFLFVGGFVYSVAMDLRLWCGAPSRVCFAGDVLSYDFSVSYVGPLPFVDVFLMVGDVPSGWGFRFVYGGYEVDSVRLMNKTSVNLVLMVYVPGDAAPGSYDFHVVACYDYPPYKSYLSLRATVKPMVGGLVLSCLTPAKVVEAGGTVSFDVRVKYYGVRDEFRFSVPDLPSGWGVSFYYGLDEILLVSLNNGDEVTVRVKFSVPMDASVGDYNLTLKVYSKSVGECLNLMVRVKPSSIVSRGLKVSVDYPIVDVEAGRTVYFTLTIRNVGLMDEVVYLNLTDKPSGWSTTFRVAGKVVRGLLLPAGGSVNVAFEATPSPYINIGEHRFKVQVYSEDKVIVKDLTLIVNVIGSYSLSITFPEFPALYFTINSGESKSFTVTVTNTGFLNVTNVYVSVDVPSAIDWRVNVEPNKVLMLKPNDKVDFKVTIYVSTIVSAGDYFITVKAVSDQVSSTARDVRVSVTKPTEWGYIGFGIVLVALVLVVIVFRRFGRR